MWWHISEDVPRNDNSTGVRLQTCEVNPEPKLKGKNMKKQEKTPLEPMPTKIRKENCTKCEECGLLIPDNAKSHLNVWHNPSCSLHEKKEKFTIPPDVVKMAKKSKALIRVTPKELLDLIRKADKALNGGSNDAEHDALYEIREEISNLYEDLNRWR